MGKYEIQIKDKKSGKVVGYKTIIAPTATSIVKSPSKYVGSGRRISNIYFLKSVKKTRSSFLGGYKI